MMKPAENGQKGLDSPYLAPKQKQAKNSKKEL